MQSPGGVTAGEDRQTSDTHVPGSSDEQTLSLRYALITKGVPKKTN